MLTQHKYPVKHVCCNDTITGCSILCCKKQAPSLEFNTTEKEAHDKLIWEKTVDKTVESINGSWSWASAGLLNTACQATIALDGRKGLSDVARNWIYFICIYIAGVLVAVAEHSLESPERIAKELELTAPQKKAAMGDQQALKKQKEIAKQAAAEPASDDRLTTLRRMLKFVSIEGLVLLDNLENLFISTISNVAVLALNAAATASFNAILEDTKASGSTVITAQWVFVFVVAWITMFGSLQIGQTIDKMDVAVYDYLQEHGAENSKTKLLQHSTIKRIFKLLEYSFSLVLAWTIRNALKATILSIYGISSGESLRALWIYTVLVTVLVTYLNTMTKRYFWLYPRDDFVELQLSTDRRKFFGKVLYSNLQAVVGIAWYDAILETPEALSDEDLEKHRIWILWLISVFLLFFSSFMTGYWTKAKLEFRANSVGPVEAFFEAFDNWFDPHMVLSNGKLMLSGDGNRDGRAGDDDNNGKDKARRRRESFEMEFLECLVDLVLFSLSFASGWLIGAAVKALVIRSYGKVYSTDTVDDTSGNIVWTAWLAFGIAMGFSTVLMTVLSNSVSVIRKKKHEILDRWKKELEENEQDVDVDQNMKDMEDKLDGGRHAGQRKEKEEVPNATDVEEEEDANAGDEDVALVTGDTDENTKKSEVEMQ